MTYASLINLSFMLVALVAYIAQAVINSTSENLVVASLVLASTLVTFSYLRWTQALKTHPLSSFAIFGFCATTQLGALVAKTIEGSAVIDHLMLPEKTFAYLALYQVIAIVAHSFYRMFSNPGKQEGAVYSLMRYLGIYTIPNVLHVWVMGLLGILFLLISKTSIGNGLAFLAWTPFVIPILARQFPGYCNVKVHYPLLGLHALAVAAIGMGFNARGLMVVGFASVLLIFLLAAMRSQQVVKLSHLYVLVIVGVLGAVLSWPFNNLMLAMEVARADRLQVSATKMIENTVYYFQHPQEIEKYKLRATLEALKTGYDEKYINNKMLSRLVETKFHDNGFYYGGMIHDHGVDRLWNMTGDFMWALLPQPVLDAIGIKLDKRYMYFSAGDALVNLAKGGQLGYFRTGSVFAQGDVLFGDFFPFIYFVICLLLFFAMDILTFTHEKTGVVVLSVIAMVKIWPMFVYGVTGESLHFMLGTVFRNLGQNVLLYAMVFSFAKWVVNMLPDLSKKSAVVTSPG